MPAVAMRLTLLGDDFVYAGLSEWEGRTLDMREPLRETAHIFSRLAARQFETQGVYALGHPWAPLSPRYAAWKAKMYGPRPILVATGKLRRLLTDDAIRTLGRDELEWGTFDQVAGWHQHGTVKMPARQILVVTEREEQEIEDAFMRWSERLAHEAGFRE